MKRFTVLLAYFTIVKGLISFKKIGKYFWEISGQGFMICCDNPDDYSHVEIVCINKPGVA